MTMQQLWLTDKTAGQLILLQGTCSQVLRSCNIWDLWQCKPRQLPCC